MTEPRHSLRPLLIVMLAAALLMACPYTRNTFLFQGAVALGRINELYEKVDPALALPYYGYDKVKSSKFWEEIENHPDDAGLYAGLLRHDPISDQLGNYKPPGFQKWVFENLKAYSWRRHTKLRLTPWKPLPDSPEVRKYEHAITMGQKLEPNNIYFDLFEASLRFAQGRDDDALAVLHRAAGKKQFDSHQPQETIALLSDADRRWPMPVRWLDQFRRHDIIQMTRFFRADYDCFYHSAHMAAWHADSNTRRRQYDRSLAIMTDLVRIGGVMRDGTESVMGAGRAGQIQKMGVWGVYYSLVTDRRMRFEQPSTEMFAKVRSAIPTALSPVEWDALGDNLARSVEFRQRAVNYYHGNWGWPFAANLALLEIAGNLLIRLLTVGFLWLIALVWLRIRRAQTLTAGPCKLSIWLIAILPSMAASAFVIAVRMMHTFGMLQHPTGKWAFYAPMTALMMVTPAIVAIIAGARTRIEPEMGRLDTFLGRLRVGSVYAAQALVILYILVMIAALPVTEKARIANDRMLSNEVQTMWDYQPK